MNTDNIVRIKPTFKTFKINSNEYKLLQNKILQMKQYQQILN